MNGGPEAVLLTTVLVGMNAASANYLALGCFFFFNSSSKVGSGK